MYLIRFVPVDGLAPSKGVAHVIYSHTSLLLESNWLIFNYIIIILQYFLFVKKISNFYTK